MKWMDTKSSAILLKVSPRTLERMRCSGGGPVFSKIGKLVRYSEQDITDWMNLNRKSSTSKSDDQARSIRAERRNE